MSGDERRRRTRVIELDGDVHVVVARRANGLSTRRLGPRDAALVRRALDDFHADLEARLVGYRGRRPTR